ncbi:MAG: hypothetical protein DRO23_09280 [Thermoprotei archaeon]|nr:MAG: hypothetical protein DRO23_09280 [Thermoprotei archaeon]
MEVPLSIIIAETKVTIIGFTMSEAFEYVDTLWNFLRENLPKELWNDVTIEVSGISGLNKLSFKWSVSIDASNDLLFEEILLSLTEKNFLTNKKVEII